MYRCWSSPAAPLLLLLPSSPLPLPSRVLPSLLPCWTVATPGAGGCRVSHATSQTDQLGDAAPPLPPLPPLLPLPPLPHRLPGWELAPGVNRLSTRWGVPGNRAQQYSRASREKSPRSTRAAVFTGGQGEGWRWSTGWQVRRQPWTAGSAPAQWPCNTCTHGHTDGHSTLCSDVPSMLHRLAEPGSRT